MLQQLGQQAADAAFHLAQASSAQKDRALSLIADALQTQAEAILAANQLDIQEARENGLSEALIDRLLLTPERLEAISHDVRHVISLADPVGQIIDGGVLASGLKIERVRVPLGVVGVIYEARPNVTIDVAALCLKTGNAVILRGGKETRHSNEILVKVVQQALADAGLPRHAVQAITDPNRDLVMQLLKLDRYVDMLIPRGGAALHKLCKEHATIPVIIGGVGVCHTFVEQSAQLAKAAEVIFNAKTQRPSTCNTLETLLVQRPIAKAFLALLVARLQAKKVRYHARDEALALLRELNAEVVEVAEAELSQEWGSLDLNVLVVDDINQAIAHIRQYGTGHSESILTENLALARQFIQQVDAAAVYLNASTRFTDGAQFGLGAEVAVSTQKLHARGPMGLEALTSYKWIGVGDYTCRG